MDSLVTVGDMHNKLKQGDFLSCASFLTHFYFADLITQWT